VFKPRVVVGVGAEDNVFYEQNNADDDIFYLVQPELNVSTTWSRNAAELTVGLTDRRYSDQDSENRTDEYVRGQVRIDVVGDTNITIGGSHVNLGAGRNAPDTPLSAAKPGDYDITEGYIGAAHTFNRVRISGQLTHRELNFDAVPLIGGGFDDSQDRDRIETVVSARAEYAISPRTAVFVELAEEDRDYRRAPPQAAANRDNKVQRVLGGVNFDVSALVRGEVAVGYLDQSFDAPGFSGASGLAVDANVQWFPQEMTTVSLGAARRAEETTVGISGSYVYTEASARVDHELLQNVILTAQLLGGQRDFENISRKDDLAAASAGVRYLVNREVEVGAGWTFERQESSGGARDRDFDSNRFTLTLTLRR
jgi:hypothetical protein